jgi:hypothetical protein
MIPVYFHRSTALNGGPLLAWRRLTIRANSLNIRLSALKSAPQIWFFGDCQMGLAELLISRMAACIVQPSNRLIG